MYNPWGRNESNMTNWLSLQFTVGLTEGQGSWINVFIQEQETENTEEICTPEPHGVLLSFKELRNYDFDNFVSNGA